MADLSELIRRLEAISEELGDLAIAQLRESLESGESRHADEERRITRARRSVDKAAVILAGMPDDMDDV